jgi:hypothetical protein
MTTEDRGKRLALIGGLSNRDGEERWRKHVLYCDGSLKGHPVKVILLGTAQMRATLSVPDDGILERLEPSTLEKSHPDSLLMTIWNIYI